MSIPRVLQTYLVIEFLKNVYCAQLGFSLAYRLGLCQIKLISKTGLLQVSARSV